ncbi:MAG: hypothetical protein K6A80_05840 [Saccharofermentans sp.]|nr:hypothetical protein [Saccharofermentans sp.]
MNNVYILTEEGRSFSTEEIEFIVKNFLEDRRYRVDFDEETVYHQGSDFNVPNYFIECVAKNLSWDNRCFIACSLPELNKIFFIEFDDQHLETFKKQLKNYTEHDLRLTTWEMFKLIDEVLNKR